ncbi:MAG: uncharacterized membrane protein YsdA (DUF1294 family) [Flavobacterium sp.]
MDKTLNLLNSILIYLLIINSITFFVFGYDKWLSGLNKRRVPERSLFILVFLGGTIGGLGAMNAFRHKTSKTFFIVVVYGILILQLGLLYFGMDFLKRFT